MKRTGWLFVCLGLIVFEAPSVHAADGVAYHRNGSLGFHHVEAPIGGRLWFPGQTLGFDVGLGLRSTPASVDPDESELGWAIDFGVPFVLQSWSGVHLLARPGVLYESQEIGYDGDTGAPGVQFETETESRLTVTVELEAEVFLRDNFSVSGSHGVGFSTFDPGFGADSQTSFGTMGAQFTNIGFHLYCFGGAE